MLTRYLGLFRKSTDIRGPAEELAKSPGFESMLTSIDLEQGDVVQNHIMEKYGVDDKTAEKIFIEADKIYQNMMKRMSKDEKIEYRIKCNQK